MKTHHPQTLLLLVVALAAGFVAPVAQAAKFVRPGLLHFSYAESGYADKTGVSLAAGADWGPARQHELSVELGRVGWTYGRLGGPIGSITGDGNITSLLAGYRYYLGAGDAKFRPYAGAMAGAFFVSGNAAVFLSGTAYGDSLSETELMYGATLGAVAKLGGSFSLDVGYRYLGGDDISAGSRTLGVGGFTGPAGPPLKLPAPSAHVVAVALKFEW